VPHYDAANPISLILYTAFFIAVTLLTIRRPVYGLCALIFVQPFAYWQYIFNTTITLPKAALFAVLLGLLVYRDAFAPLAAPAPRRILLAGIFVLLATVLSYAQATYHEPAILECLKALEYIMLFCVTVAAFRLDPDRGAVRSVFYASAIAVSLLALSQEALGAPSALLINGHVTPRIAGPLEGPNQLAGFFDVMLPVVLALAMSEPSAIAFIALALIACTDVLTFSRGGAFGAVAAIAAVLFVYRRPARGALVSLGGGAVAGALVALGWGLAAHSLGIFRLWTFDESSYAGGVGTRSELWSAAIALWRQHPVLGVGAGNFELDIPRTGLRGVRTHANSLYLQSLVEGGIPMLAATVWLVYTSIATFVRERLNSPFVVAAFAASVALALHQVVDFLTFYPKVGGEWWIVLGLGAAELAVAAKVRQAACV
jgi:putative inorganic carbon (hco3(-)) transporter